MTKKIFFNFSILSCLLPISMLSCTTNDNVNKKDDDASLPIIPPYEEENNDKNEKPNEDFLTNEDLKLFIDWKEGFRNQKTIFFNWDSAFPFKLGEIIYSESDYEIQYSGDSNEIAHYSLLDKSINKYYLCSIKASYERLSKFWTKAKLKNYISSNLIQNYKEQMIVEHQISDEDFFLPIDVSDKSLNFENNEIITFESSWGVWNHQERKNVFDINIDLKKIRNTLFGTLEHNYENLKIKSLKATDLFIYPKIVIVDTPIGYFDFNVDDIKNTKNEKYLELSNEEKAKLSIDLPGANNSINWTGMIQNRIVSGNIINTEYINGLSSLIGSMIVNNDENYKQPLIEKIAAKERTIVKKYIDDIMKKGRRIALNMETNLNDNSLISLKVSSTIKSGANSASLFADGSQVAVYGISAIQKMNIKFIEYKKF